MTAETSLRDLARKMVARRPNTVQAFFTGGPTDGLQGLLATRDVEAGLDISGVAPVFYCPTSDATALVPEVEITIESVVYTIKQVHKRASGISAMLLENA